MTRWKANLGWAAVTVVLAASTSFLVMRMVATGPEPASEADFHEWVHQHLELRPAQHRALAPSERVFERERARLRQQIAQAGSDLALAVQAGDPEAPAIEASLLRLNAAQAELQRVTLDHFFTMKEHLDPAQSAKLLKWTHDSIVPK